MKCFKEPLTAWLAAELLDPPPSAAGRAQVLRCAIGALDVEKGTLAKFLGVSAQSRERSWVPVAEREIFPLVPRPMVPDAPTPPPDEADGEDGGRLPWSLCVGIPGIGVAALGAVAALAGCAVPCFANRWGLDVPTTQATCCGLCGGGVLAAAVGVVLGVVGFGSDAVGAADELATDARRKSARGAYERLKREHAAAVRKANA